MTRDQYMEEVFLKPPLVAYRRPRNLRECLSEQNSRTGNTRDQGGKWREWENVRTVLSVHWHWWRLGTRSDQHHQNMSMKWEESLTARQKTSVTWFSVRKKAAASSTLENPSTPPSTDGPNNGYVTGPGNQATGEHFNSKGHSLADMEFSSLETFKNGAHHLRKEREKYYINKFNTKHKGMNNKK